MYLGNRTYEVTNWTVAVAFEEITEGGKKSRSFAALRMTNHRKRPGSLLLPGFSVVCAAPDFVVAGGKNDLRRGAHLNVSDVGGKGLAFDGRLYLQPSCAAVGGMEQGARLSTGPHILVVRRVAQQWMIGMQCRLPALAAVPGAFQEAGRN